MANEKIKLLIVDDSAFMRNLVRELLADEKYIDIVDEAKNGEEAIKKAKELKPAVIIMDYKMPIKNGLEATEEIMKTKDYSPGIVIFSAYTEDGIKEGFHSLRVGAIDFIAKPDGSKESELRTIKAKLILKIKVAANAFIHAKTKDLTSDPLLPNETKIKNNIQVVVIGASTGGPPVVERIIKGINSNFKGVLLVVQHMPEKFTSIFAELTNKESEIEVKQAEESEELKPGTCYIAPSGQHMKIEKQEDDTGEIKKIIHLTREPKVSGYRPSIDVLMNSVSKIYKEESLGIILTGMGSDGLKGSINMHDNGAYIIAQSLQTAVIESMPSSIINAGVADEVLSPREISNRINSLNN
ncbi:chemotaxis response regulator protein-glutamate methylesterase [Candidatus Parcubacteria bacterium]|nr:MAG: chemotaxis response regulator protein-glutamate methylesterase [Candidatus Parcubacteria bacterium]